jgi:hypothetical protein
VGYTSAKAYATINFFILEYLFTLMMTVRILKEDIPEEVAAPWA